MLSKKVAVTLVVVSGAALAVFAVAGDQHCQGKGSSAKLEVIKQLAGDWVRVGGDGRPTDQIFSSYRVTAGGSAVLETLFCGTNHEMITVYHEDGEHLVLTHYCTLGNQPHMRAEPTDDPNRIVFKCAGVSNAKSENDEHMHEGRLTILGDDRIKTEWLKFKDGKNDYTASFELVRKAGQRS